MSVFEDVVRSLAAGTSIPFMVRFAGGRSMEAGEGPPQFRIRFKSRAAERRTAVYRHIGLLESYFAGEVDIDGDLGAMFRLGMYSPLDTPNLLVRARNAWHEVRFSNRDPAQAKANARSHYALGEPFYRTWLDDPLMMYTCGYWPEGVTTLEQAQRAKVEHVCRKVRLAPGERVIDVGCGFGGFMFHAAEHHGVHVTGLNTTTEQIESLRPRLAASPYAEHFALVEADFRDVAAAPGPFDKVVSIGVLEHAGRDQLVDVVRAHAAWLKPGGLGMLHFIGHVGRHETEFFIRKHVFPGGWIPSLAATIEAMEDAGLEVIDIENLRRHYALTLDEWARRFDARWPAIHAIDSARFDERFRRIWRTYLIGCAEMFRAPAAGTHLFQIVFGKGPRITRESYPMSRAFLYRDA